jgi:hypothetical protein
MGTLQRALVYQWQAAGALLASVGLFVLTMAMSPSATAPLFLALISLLVVPFGLASLNKRLRLYRLAAFWCIIASICSLMPLLVLFTAVTSDLYTLLDLGAAALFTTLFALPIATASYALIGMGAALYAAPPSHAQLGSGDRITS